MTDRKAQITTSDGYLIDQSLWTEALARQFAQEDGIDELTEAHWQVIYFLRNFYQQYQHTPPIRVLVKCLQEKFGGEIGNSIYLQQLFPNGPAKQASRLAGLPRPTRCT
jgi:tRNA 2-thiouridine synthesizing protein E